VNAKSLAGALILLAAAPAASAQMPADAAAGHQLASKLCTGCHIVGTESAGSDIAPPFPVIARDPSMTLTELHGWIEPGHPVLPHLALSSKQTADINAYLDSLLGPGPEPAAGQSRQAEEPPPAILRAPPGKLGEPIQTQPK
jgi:mono/diheme cytochrome c family protein